VIDGAIGEEGVSGLRCEAAAELAVMREAGVDLVFDDPAAAAELA
jgi:hypothetical protein